MLGGERGNKERIFARRWGKGEIGLFIELYLFNGEKIQVLYFLSLNQNILYNLEDSFSTFDDSPINLLTLPAQYVCHLLVRVIS